MRISHQTRIVLQAFLDSPDDESYGFVLAQITGLAAGTLYPVLQRLLSDGWLAARWEDVDERAEGRRRRRYYRLTGVGELNARAAVASDASALRALMPGWVP